jgi:hypothetical protein
VGSRHGYRYLLLERQEFIKALYEPIRTGHRVNQIIEHDQGIRVDLADGTSEYGGIVVGYDGVFG